MFHSKTNSMKKIQIFALAALLLGFASCSKELDNGIGGQDASSGFQISLQASKGTLTYADIATAPEWDFGAVDVFIFEKTSDRSGTLLGTNANFDMQPATGSVTLTAKGDWLADNSGKFVNVYFVGNNEAANLFTTETSATSQVGTVSAATTEAALIELLTVAQPLDGDNKAELLETPLLFSVSSQNIEVPLIGMVKVDATLKRREARFDIVNPFHANFNITKVFVSNANIEGFIFADATTTPTMAKASLKEIDLSSRTDYDADDLMPSVFYLYPTQLGTGNTEITIFGVLDGEDKIFEVNSTALIDANKRYKLVFDPAAMVFNVVAADYDEGVRLPTQKSTGAGILSLTAGAGTGVLTNTSYQLVAGQNATLTVVLGGSANKGFDITVSGGAGITTAAAIQATYTIDPFTYSGGYYPVTYTIATTYGTSIPGTEVFITFTDANNPKNRAVVLLYDGTSRVAEPASNSYMVKPNGADISIPLSRVYEHWTALATDANFGVKFLWTDNENGMTRAGVVSDVHVQGKGDDAVLLVRPGAAEGNAVVAVTVGDDIKWSWHIWNTAYDPTVGGTYDHTSTGTASAMYPGRGRTHTFMDRNLGALNATPGDVGAIGLMYQWGRKDAFWSSNVWANTNPHAYDAGGRAFNERRFDVVTNVNVPTGLAGNSVNNLNYAVENPSTYLFSSIDHTAANGGVGQDWYTVGYDRSKQNTTLWAVVDGSFNVTKQLYDPCPNGYRVHENGSYSGITYIAGAYAFPWSGTYKGRMGSYNLITGVSDWTHPTSGPGASNNVGYYPASGNRNSFTGAFTNVGTAGFVWSSTHVDVASGAASYALHINPTTLNFSSTNGRARGLPVRCILDN